MSNTPDKEQLEQWLDNFLGDLQSLAKLERVEHLNKRRQETKESIIRLFANYYMAPEPEIVWVVKPSCPALELCPDATIIGEYDNRLIVLVPEGDSHFWECNSMTRVSGKDSEL